MATLYISEYALLAATTQGSDIPEVPAPSTLDQTVAIGSGSLQSNAFQASTRYVEVSCDLPCALAFGTNPTATVANLTLAQYERKLFAIPQGQAFKVAVIQNGTGGGGGGGNALFNNSVSANLNTGTTYHDFDPTGYTAGTTNRLALTPSGANQTLDGLLEPGTDGFSLLLVNKSLSYSIVLNDQNFSGNGSAAGNLFQCPNPFGAGSTAIQSLIPPGGAQLLVYVNSVWVLA